MKVRERRAGSPFATGLLLPDGSPELADALAGAAEAVNAAGFGVDPK